MYNVATDIYVNSYQTIKCIGESVVTSCHICGRMC